MAIVRWRGREWDPLRELGEWQRDMANLFESSLETLPERISKEATWAPSMDITEDKENIMVKVDLPGVKQQDIDIEVTGKTLTIKGERKHEEEKKEKNYHRVERFYGSYARTVTLPEYVDMEKIKAEYKNGVLELSIPKKEEAKPKQIKVEVK